MVDSPLPKDCYHYEPPAALWELVEKNVPPHERQEIRKMLGESLVEQSLELHLEVNTLLEIWREYREETEEIFTKHRLPEPPSARERLKQEIKFFVQSIRDKAKETGRNADCVLDQHKTDVIDYALDTDRSPSSGYHSRPSTAMSSRDGRETPMRTRTPVSDRVLAVSTLSDEVEAINDKLTYLQFDEVLQHLRETLEDEVLQLTRDIEFLQTCLDDEADFRGFSGPSREPTLTELREERSKLEKELLTSVSSIPQVLRESNKEKSVINSINQPPHSAISESHQIQGSPLVKCSPQLTCPRKLKERNLSSPSGSLRATNHVSSSGLDENTQISIPKSRPMKANLKVSTTSGSKANHVVSQTGPIKANHQISSAILKSKSTTSPEDRVKIQPQKFVENSRKTKSGSSAKAVGDCSKFDIPDTPVEHVTIRTSRHVPVQKSGGESNLIPSPPSSGKPNRPGSADRFRRMVINCRDQQ